MLEKAQCAVLMFYNLGHYVWPDVVKKAICTTVTHYSKFNSFSKQIDP